MATVSFNTHFPGYDVLGEITRSNARVLKARHVATGDLVAIKHFSLNTDTDTLRRFERESVIMTRMDHPNIVKVREVRLDTELPYLVMDYIEGGSLRQLITESGHLSVEMTVRMGLQILDAFRLIHAQGIVHRDVKPENILYHKLASGELHFLLTDFGIARLHEQPVTQTGQSLMTYEYAAPEQFDNPRQVDETTDYYAFGVILYECFTGKVPFVLGSETGIVTFMNAVLTTPPPAPVLPTSQSLPEGLTDLLRQLLAKKSADRIHDPDEIKLILKQAEVEQLYREKGRQPAVPMARTESHSPVPAQVAPRLVVGPAQGKPAKPVVAASSSRKKWLLPALAVLVVLGGALAYWGFSRTDTRPTAVQESVEGSQSAAAGMDTARQAEEARLRLEQARQLYQVEVTEATRKLAARTIGGSTGLFGGVKDLSVQLKNPSIVTFRSVAVKVEYLKGNGRLLKSTVIYFNQVGPRATMTRQAPDNQRGTRFRAQVLRADPEMPDSLASPPVLTP